MNDTLEIIARQDGTVEIAAGIQGDANIEAKVEQPAEIHVEVMPAGPRGAPGQDGRGVASGGSAGDFLRKRSGTDYDTEWDEFPSIKKGTDADGTAVIIGDLSTNTASGLRSIAAGEGNTVETDNSIAVGKENTITTKKHAAAFGRLHNVSGAYGFATGYGHTVSQSCALASGDENTASGPISHAEGQGTTASAQAAHSENYHTIASGQASHAEGHTTTASGSCSHSEGGLTLASGLRSHAEGENTEASGADAHAEGFSTIANHAAQHVLGRYNIPDPSENASITYGDYAEIVGNGTSNARSNARTLDWSGNEVLAGKLTVGSGPSNNMDVATKQYVDSNIPTVPTNISDFVNDAGYITGIDSSDVTTALGYTPYSNANPDGYITGIDSGDVTAALGFTPYSAANPDGFVDAAGAAAAAPVTSVNGQTGAVSLTIPTVPTDVSAFNNDAGYITTVTSADVTNALGYTPYSDANPSGFVDSAGAASAAPVQSVNGQTGAVTVTVPTKTSDLQNDSGFITDAGVTSFNGATGAVTYTAPVTSVNSQTGAVSLSIPSTASDIGALPDNTTYAASPSVGGPATVANGIHYAQVDNTSTATAFTATISGITSYYDGLTILLKNGIITSASGFTININNLGAKQAYSNMAAATAETTIFNINYTMLFVYDSTRVAGGGWICYRGYNSDNNTIGYQVRTNSMSLPMTSVVYRYRLLFQSADNAHYVPANNSTSTNATAARSACQDPINPFGRIVYYGTTASVAAGSRPSTGYQWRQYVVTIGYSFQTSPNYTLTTWKPLYLRCTPQANGSAVIDSTTPFVQDLPTTEDGKIYIWLGVAHTETAFELTLEHPVYWYKSGHIRLYTNAATPTKADIGLGNVDNVQQYSASNPPPYPVTSVNGSTGAVTLTIPSTASDVGAVAVAQGVGHAGEFLVVGSNGNVTTMTLSTWQGGSY